MLIMDQALFIRYVDINVKKKNSLKPHFHTREEVLLFPPFYMPVIWLSNLPSVILQQGVEAEWEPRYLAHEPSLPPLTRSAS